MPRFAPACRRKREAAPIPVGTRACAFDAVASVIMMDRQRRLDGATANAVARGLNILAVRNAGLARRYMECKQVPDAVITRVLADPGARRRESAEQALSEAITPQSAMPTPGRPGTSDAAPNYADTRQLQAMLALARELLQVEEPSTVLSLSGRAIAELLGKKPALLLIGDDFPLLFAEDGSTQLAPADHPWALAAHARMRRRPSRPEVPEIWVIAAPQARPMAVLVAEPVACAPEVCRKLGAALETALELLTATLGRIQVRCSLEKLVTTQHTQLVDNAQKYADELTRRDRAAREMLSLTLTDVLTGLNNRRGFFARAEPLFRLAQRKQANSAVIYADIDGLKPVNDTLGHAVGDQMIRDAADVLSDSLREADVLARMGGDEFVAYALDQAQPLALLARLQRALDDFNVSQERPFRLSLSVGMVPCDPKANTTLNECIQLADQAMYEHKRRLL